MGIALSAAQRTRYGAMLERNVETASPHYRPEMSSPPPSELEGTHIPLRLHTQSASSSGARGQLISRPQYGEAVPHAPDAYVSEILLPEQQERLAVDVIVSERRRVLRESYLS